MPPTGAPELGDRLTNALNAAIGARPEPPFARMAAHLRAHKDQPPMKPGDPEASAQLLPEISAYLEQHSVQAVLGGIAKSLAPLPPDPVSFLAIRLESQSA